MPDTPGYGFTYNPGTNNETPSELFAWQICLAHLEEGSLEDADNYVDYAVNRGQITQTLGFGMANGQNAFELDGQMFVVAISVQVNGQIQLIDSQHGHYGALAAVVAEQLLRGSDHGMVALMPNGNLVPFIPPVQPQAE